LVESNVLLTIRVQSWDIPVPRQVQAADGREKAMKSTAVESGGALHAPQPLKRAIDTHRLGLTLRTVYEGSVDTQPITDTQVDLLLRLRQKERDLRRAG
jgi:hypothetical protein